VCDLVRAHSAALAYLRGGGASATLNCGYGRGFSVLNVIETVKRVSGVDFKVELAGRRAGDRVLALLFPTPTGAVVAAEEAKSSMFSIGRYAPGLSFPFARCRTRVD
jgi:UDP-glucose 4-epimerase